MLIAPPPTWQAINPANSPFSLDKEFGVATATARQHSGGGREDTLVVGAPGESRYARVTFSHGLPMTPRSLYVDVVRRAAEAGLSVERNGLSGLLVTKFGSLESASITLGGPAEQNCQAFRFHDPDSAFGFQGWLCGQDAQPVEKADLACFIDSMTLLGSRRNRPEGAFRPRGKDPFRNVPDRRREQPRAVRTSGPTLIATRCMTLQP